MSDNNAINSIHRIDPERFHRIYTVLHEMLKDRGYKSKHTELRYEEWCSRYLGFLSELEEGEVSIFTILDKMMLLFERDGIKLIVYFHPIDSKLCQADMNYIYSVMKKKKAIEIIIIVNSNATSKVGNLMGIMGHNAQLFTENELVFNVTKHQLVPQHIKCTEKEREMILKEYTLDEKGMEHPEYIPAIYVTDPIVKYYNFRVGDLIKILRPRKDGYYDISYRIVTNTMLTNE